MSATEFTSINGKPLDLTALGAKAVLVVNTASKCGFTPQYKGLQALYEDKKDDGLVIVGIPSNDFMGQEPGTEEEIREFCTLTYGVKFPMFEKVTVKGDDAAPFYRMLAADPNGAVPGWNFHKFLIGRDGHLVANYGSRVKPDDAAMIERIEALLAEPAPN